MRPVRAATDNGRPSCAPTLHQHTRAVLVCVRCGVDSDKDGTVSQTTTRDGRKWAPTCSNCHVKLTRLRALSVAVADCA